jgi:tetratricopeptide (TPR) repeat protein
MNIKRSIILVSLLLLVLLQWTVTASASDDLLKEGINEYKAENFEEALDLLHKAREQQPNSSLAAFYLGLSYKQVGEYRLAENQFRDSLTLVPPVKDAYIELAEVLYILDELKEAQDLIAESEKENIKPGHTAFLKGLVLLKRGNFQDAVEAFRKAKEFDPSLSQPADFQIATAYLKERRFNEAKKSLRAVLEVNPTSELASFAKEYEKALTRTLEMYEPWRFTVGIAYQYDDNVVLKPSTAIPDIEITGEKDSSLVGTFGIDYIPLSSGPWIFNAQYNLYTNTYRNTNSHNLIVQSLSFIPGYNFSKGAISLPLSSNYVWVHEKEYLATFSTKPTLSIMFIPGHIGQFSIGYEKREFLQSPPDKDEDRDADAYSVSAGYVHPFSGGRGMFNLKYEFSKEDTKGKNWINNGNRINTGLLIPMSDRVKLIMSGDLFMQDYKNTHTIFGKKRQDVIYTGSGTLMFEILRGLNVLLQYTHATADSNIAIYDYNRNIYTAGFEYRF